MKGLKTRHGCRLLQEDYVRGTTPHKVDREAGIIFGVKVLGRTSPNSHGMTGADGSEYTLEALEQAAKLYENVPVNIDHPPREKPNKERSAHDRFGRLQNVKVTESGVYADLQYLKTHPMAERICEAAERMPDLFGLSHNAMGRGEVQNGRYVIVEIPEVRSVDVVADAGTVSSLFESKGTMSKKKIKEVFESLVLPKLKPAKRTLLRGLLEMGEPISPDTEMPVKEEGEMAAADPDDLLAQGFEAAIMAVVQATDLDAAGKTAKIKELLKTQEKLLTPTEPPAEEPAETPAAEGEEEKPKDEEKPVKESKEQAAALNKRIADQDKAIKELQEERATLKLKEKCQELCEAAQVPTDKSLLEGLVAMRDETKIKAHVEYLKKLTLKANAQRPRSQSPGAGTVTLEGKAAPAKDAKEFALALVG